MICRFIWLLILVGSFACIPCIVGKGEEIPNDFKLVAVYGPGESSWKPWKVTITADGKALQETCISWANDNQKTFTLTKEDLQQLVARVQESHFYSWRKEYPYEVKDVPTLILRVTMSGKSHEVTVADARGYLKDKEDVKRFLKIWNEVLRKVPSPNQGQKSE